MQALYSEVRRNLEVLLGCYPSGELVVDPGFVPVPPPVQAGLPGSLLERRPDLLASERQVLVAFRNLEASKLALLPTITLTAGGGRLDDQLLSLLNLNPTLFHSALQIYVPLYEGGEFTTPDLEKIVFATHTGMSVDSFQVIVKDWAEKTKDHRWKRSYTELVYQPMIEVLRYLREKEFKTYIVTGGGQDFVRVYSDKVYGVPVENVIGSIYTTHTTPPVAAAQQ